MKLLRFFDPDDGKTIEFIAVKTYTRGMTDKLIRQALEGLDVDFEVAENARSIDGGGEEVAAYIGNSYRFNNRHRIT